jgi:biopolymer transport protein TolR
MRYSRRRNNGNDRPMAEINVTPLVDVMLVLLVIFMVTAPMLQTGIDVNLPKVSAKSVDVAEEKVVLTINASRELFINRRPLGLSELGVKLQSIFAQRIDREVYMRADRSVPYGFVVEVMAEIRKAGVDKLGMITEPLEERR